ncbi:peptidase family M48 [Colletotrichum orchidophilum]|uniref:Peptidase family M48 n=1 Tax=Colletotrichum orchidophilum TaxID=1209926 RepID=A0A1G4AV52_9PEZI|nr:peptidase family M48 [Colletotrichum orchidophilum]OHE92963.1 peptidase family M48 [Colletotrichum orchidophilum]
MFPLCAVLRPPALRAVHHPSSLSLLPAGLSFPTRQQTRIPTFSIIRGSSRPQQHHPRPFSQTVRRPAAGRGPGGYDPRNPAHREVLNEYNLRTARPLVTNDGIWRLAKSRGTHTVIILAVLSACAFYFYNVQTVPVSGRKRFNCYSESMVESVSGEQVKRVIYDVESQGGRFLPSWDPRAQMVARVMRRLIPVSGLEGLEWEVRVIDDPGTLNAFVLPGGKVFVHSGILRVTRNEDGLAAVLGHEIAHNLAQHVGERMSSSIGPNIMLGSLVLLSGMFPPAIILVQYLGSGLMDLLFTRPMGRLQESEADYIGLMLMAEACYDPREALAFWQRMDMAAKRGHAEEIPELLSTHPSNEHRIEKYQEWMPKAVDKFEASDCKGTASFANMFRRALDRGSMIVEF